MRRALASVAWALLTTSPVLSGGPTAPDGPMIPLGRGPESAPSLSADRVPWSRLEFKFHKLTVGATLAVSAKRVPSRDARSTWLTPEQGEPVEATGQQVVEIEEVVDITGRRFDTTLWLDGQDAAVIQRVILETKKNTHQKIYRFTEDGYDLLDRRPASPEERKLPATDWSQETRTPVRYPTDYDGNAPIVDASSIFWVLSASSLESKGDSIELLVFSKTQIGVVTFTAEGLEPVDIEYTAIIEGDEIPQSLERALRISVETRPLDPAAKSDFGHLGLSQSASYLIDPHTRIPVEMTGRARLLGKVVTRLDRVVLDKAATAETR